jgi:hypothetical protein
LAALALLLVAADRTQSPAPVELGAPIPLRDSAEAGFPLGWYDSLDSRGGVFDMAQQGMNMVLPYHTEDGSPKAYLDTARAAGVQVVLEIDRSLVRTSDSGAVREYVARYKEHPAVYGWYLADEPTTTKDLGPLSPKDANRLYRAIKDEDGDRPVAVAFGAHEKAERFRHAMDVMLFDDYPVRSGQPEFGGLSQWWDRLRKRAEIGSEEGGFFPVLQAFGEDDQGNAQFGRRLPTEREQRYMIYSSVQAGATGLLFWNRYRAADKWIDQVLVPIVAELRTLGPALGSGDIRGVSSDEAAVSVSLFRDPRSREYRLLAVHHGEGTVSANVSLGSQVDEKRVYAWGEAHEIDATGGAFKDTFGPFETRLYNLT